MISFKGAQFPQNVIPFAMFFYVRDTVSYGDLEDRARERHAFERAGDDGRAGRAGGSCDAQSLALAFARQKLPGNGVAKYSPLIASNARRRKARAHRSWRMDET
jgi:putative transposase